MLHTIKKQISRLYYCLKDADTPLYSKAIGYLGLAYALSPIDLIPDVIPVLGYLDDAILLPIILYAFYLSIPKDVWSKSENADFQAVIPKSRIGAMLVILCWILSVIAIFVIYDHFKMN